MRKQRAEDWTDAAIRKRASELVRAYGPKHAAEALGVSRDTALSIAAGAKVMPATFALIRERMAEGEVDHG